MSLALTAPRLRVPGLVLFGMAWLGLMLEVAVGAD